MSKYLFDMLPRDEADRVRAIHETALSYGAHMTLASVSSVSETSSPCANLRIVWRNGHSTSKTLKTIQYYSNGTYWELDAGGNATTATFEPAEIDRVCKAAFA